MKRTVATVGIVSAMGFLSFLDFKQEQQLDNLRADKAVQACVDKMDRTYDNVLFGQCIADFYYMKGWTK